MKNKAVFYIALLVILAVCEAALTGYVPEVRKVFYDILGDKNMAQLPHSLGLFAAVGCGLVFSTCFKGYFSSLLSLLYRNKLVSDKLSKPLTNPTAPGRIERDTDIVTGDTVLVVTESFIAFLVASYMVYSVGLSPMLYLAMLYLAIHTLITLCFRVSMIKKQYIKRTAEDNFRQSMELSLKGQESDALFTYEHVKNTVYKLALLRLSYNTTNRLGEQILGFLPLVVLIPAYFQGTTSLGDLMKNWAEFDLLVANVGILLYYFGPLTEAWTSYKRLKEI
jgi:ABC-type uncharacterized transport system fused permease/ATPase subunit